MSNNLQEINNLKQELLQNPLRTIQIGHSNYERIDNDTIKILCVACGGKGYYLLMQGFPTDTNAKGEIVSCDCEKGFKYSKMNDNHGNP